MRRLELMKINRIIHLTFVAAALALVLPARAETMSVPSAAKPAFTFEVPSDWKPKADAKDESVEASAPGDAAYVTAWIANVADEKELGKDLEATLKDSMKSIDGEPTMREADQNGSHFYVYSGSGVDKRAGNKVKFLVAFFDVGGENAGVVYADYDVGAPDSTMGTLEKILNSIKVSKK
jgi:hypothetical protein